MRSFKPLVVTCCFAWSLTAAGLSGAAGSVAVSFAPTDRFADAGDWGQRQLPDGQSLAIEVLDVDLAGRSWPFSARGSDIRFLNGGADWPRITLRWTLSADGRTVRSGEETVADMNYLMHRGRISKSGPLDHEKAMLDAWFKSRFAGTADPS